jgi:hypothetical protein
MALHRSEHPVKDKAEEPKMAEDAARRKRAEEFADYVEAEFRKIGAVGDFFCSAQHARWREHAIRAHEGTATEGAQNATKSEAASD